MSEPESAARHPGELRIRALAPTMVSRKPRSLSSRRTVPAWRNAVFQ